METVSLVGEWLGVVLAIASVLNGIIPARYHSIPVVGLLLKVINFAAATTPPDAQGTFKLPGKRIVVRVETDPPKPPVPPLPLLLMLAMGLGLAACPGLPPSDNCAPSSMDCRNGVPVVCSQTGRWTTSDRKCTDVQATCCVTGSFWNGRPITACVPASLCLPELSDGGAD